MFNDYIENSNIEKRKRKLQMRIISQFTRAKKIVPIQEPIITETTASLKKIDDKKSQDLIPKQKERAKHVVEERETVLLVSEITTEDTAPDFTIKTKTDRAQIKSKPLETFAVTELHTQTDVQDISKTEMKQRRAKKVTDQVQIETVQTKIEESIEEKPRKKKSRVKIREEVSVEEIVEQQKENIAREVDEIMEVLLVKEFGPGESPLRELATIGYLVRQGVSVNEINESLHRTDQFPALRKPEAQNALVQLVERKGHGPLITEVLTEETTTDESIVAATVGFRAFMKMVELQHATVEEVITHFAPEDFRPRAWEATEITEVTYPQLMPIEEHQFH